MPEMVELRTERWDPKSFRRLTSWRMVTRGGDQQIFALNQTIIVRMVMHHESDAAIPHFATIEHGF